jgi:uncharacterized protein YndB with AHSA1/START domain
MMGKPYEFRHAITVDATPAQIWDAIATGPGISAWFIGRTDIDGDRVRTTFGDDWIPTGTITTRDEPHHFAHRSDTTDDGRFIAYDYLIEARDGGATTLHAVTSGFLPGDDWDTEYEAMGHGLALFHATLAEHLRHFPGRTPTTTTTVGPPVSDWPAAWKALRTQLDLDEHPAYFTSPHAIAVRTPNALHRHLYGLHGGMITAISDYR